MKKQIIISDPDDEMTHIYEDLTQVEPEPEVAAGPKEDILVACAGAIEQQEGSNINPSYMNNYD
jgi:hypothetical protein